MIQKINFSHFNIGEFRNENLIITLGTNIHMISILIPVYNQSVVALVLALKTQCEQIDTPYQILVFDDDSNLDWKLTNRSLENEFGVNYVEVSDNLGRAKIRNRLGRMARYDWLIFLDGDSQIVRDDFVQTYLDNIDKSEVIYGGRVYQSDKPDKEYMLHWKYGRTKEALSVKKRMQDPFLNFQSNNFMIKADLFNDILFDTEIKGYGYEDLLFAEEIKVRKLSLSHIDNPVLHDGLETTTRFLAKTKNAVKNLVALNQENKLLNVRLTSFYSKMKKNDFLPLILKFINWREKSILTNLNSINPSMRGFSFYKLMEYERESSKK